MRNPPALKKNDTDKATQKRRQTLWLLIEKHLMRIVEKETIYNVSQCHTKRDFVNKMEIVWGNNNVDYVLRINYVFWCIFPKPLLEERGGVDKIKGVNIWRVEHHTPPPNKKDR